MSQTNTDLLVDFEVCQNDICNTFDLTDSTSVYNSVLKRLGRAGQLALPSHDYSRPVTTREPS